jgi:hypothetical protein
MTDLKTVFRLLAVAVVSIVVVPANAHHSFAMFDVNAAQTVQGTVRAFEFGYPHTWLWVDVPDGKGGAEPWGFESASPAELNRAAGWTRATLKTGDKVSVSFCPLRDGRHGGAFITVTLQGGRRIAGARNLCVNKQSGKQP